MVGVDAVLFDLDGTLMDSEVLTDRAIAGVMACHGVPAAALPPAQTRGRTWRDIAQLLLARHPQVQIVSSDSVQALAQQLADSWIESADDVKPIPGAPQALHGAAARLRVAVVSSSPRAVIATFLGRLGVAALFPEAARVGAEDVVRGKPDPDPFLRAAARLGVDPARCVVFEDASAGLQAARAAGMSTVAVLHACAEPERCRALADRALVDYRALAPDFWDRLAVQGITALDGSTA